MKWIPAEAGRPNRDFDRRVQRRDFQREIQARLCGVPQANVRKCLRLKARQLGAQPCRRPAKGSEML